MQKLLTKSNVLSAISALGILGFYFLLYKVYIPRVSSFGCFDDCFNFMGGYFLAQGKSLYSQIFYNHAPGMAYLSLTVQSLTNPINLYDLVLKHRQFVLLFSLISNLILFLRFGYRILGFILIFELSKFYVFGDRFLAEALIVYPLIYLTGLGFEKIQKINLRKYDYVLAAIFSWFVIFMREPYVPLAVFLFVVIAVDKNLKKTKIFPIAILATLSIVTFAYHNFSELYFNLVTVNQTLLSESSFPENILKGFLYPVWILFPGENTLFHSVLIALSIPFLIMSALVLKNKQYKIISFVWVSLLFANLRPAPPGLSFFAAFHMNIWYGLFIFLSITMLSLIKNKTIRYGLIIFYFATFLVMFWPGKSFLYDKVDQNTDFITNYGIPLQVGDVISILADGNDTLFLDGYDDIIYWVSKRESTYPYSWYTSLMPGQEKYRVARLAMFENSPPDFYYGSCIENEVPQRILPEFIKDEYIRLEDLGKPSCLWIKKSKLLEITTGQWEKAGEKFYTLPIEDLRSRDEI